MNNPEKVIKIVSIIILVLGILGIIGGIIGAFFGGYIASIILNNPEVADAINSEIANYPELIDAIAQINGAIGEELSAAQLSSILSIFIAIICGLLIITSIWNCVCAGLGLKASKTGMAGAPFVLGIITLVLMILSIFSDGGINFVGIILFALYTIAAHNIKKNAAF